MGIEENKELARRFVENANKDGSSVLDEITTDNFVMHNMHSGTDLDREAMKKSNINIHIPFPNQSLTLDDIVAEGDKVSVRTTFRGTQDGKFRDIDPTGKNVSVARFIIFRLENGKLAEGWFLGDSLGTFQQLGVDLPKPQ